MAIPISPISTRRLDGTHAAVIGNGNVALDCARILSKTRAEFAGSDIVGHALEALETSAIRTITILGRRGPAPDRHDAQGIGRAGPSRGGASAWSNCADFPPIEADQALEPGQRKSVTLLREFADIARPTSPSAWCSISLPNRLRSKATAHAERLVVERTELDESGAARGTGETYEVPASLIVSCIGYSTPPIARRPLRRARRQIPQRGRPHRRSALRGRLGAARTDRHHRHQPPRRL